MEIGDLIRLKKEYYKNNTQNLAYIIGFDRDGDIEIMYLNPDPIRGSAFPDLDYKSKWELVNATNPKSRNRRYC